VQTRLRQFALANSFQDREVIMHDPPQDIWRNVLVFVAEDVADRCNL
jgi:hypothetical protein